MDATLRELADARYRADPDQATQDRRQLLLGYYQRVQSARERARLA